jgi:hypothetical protein
VAEDASEKGTSPGNRLHNHPALAIRRGGEPILRNALTAWSDIMSGVLLTLFGSLALSRRFSWAQWGSTGVGLWLLFAPIFFWTPSAAATANDTIVGALAITFSVLVPMMPGMSRE